MLLWLVLLLNRLEISSPLYQSTLQNWNGWYWTSTTKWFHSSRVKFPLVRISATWFLVSMYLIRILGSRLIRWNNQSSATLWVLETCLIVGLLPFTIIFNYSFVVFKHIQQGFLMRRFDVWGNTINGDSTRWSVLEIFDPCHWPRVSPVFQESESCFQGPKEMISEFCWTVRNWTLFLTQSNILEQMYDIPKMHNVPPEVEFWIFKDVPQKSESWNSPSLHCSAVLPTWQYCLYSHVRWIYEISRFRRLSQALVHFVMDRASLFTDHKISGRPILAKYKHFRNNLRSILVTIL